MTVGYFSNGSEGADWYGRNCRRCANSKDVNDSPGCSIWDIHLLHNYNQQADNPAEQARHELMGMLIVQQPDLSMECALTRATLVNWSKRKRA